MGTGKNVRALRDKFGLTQDQLADALGVTRESVVRWESDKMSIRDRHIAKMVELYGVEPDDIRSESNGIFAQLHGLAAQAFAVLPKGAIMPRASKAAYAPLLGRVHAGDAQDPEVLDGPMVELPESVAESHPRAYFLEVEGNCMDRVYPEGCLILVDPDMEPRNGSIAAVSIDGADYVMRRLLRTPNTMVLSPESFDPGYEDIVITAASGKTVELAGTVVWFQPAREME